jgi:hypothetical protein
MTSKKNAGKNLDKAERRRKRTAAKIEERQKNNTLLFPKEIW